MPRKKKTEQLDPKIIQDLLNRPFVNEQEPPTTLLEALQMMEYLSSQINSFLAESPLVQDYAELHAKRLGKTQGSFQLGFEPTLEFVASGRSASPTTTKKKAPIKKKEPTKKTPKKEEPKKELSPLELLWEKASELGIDISDIKNNQKSIEDRIALVEDMAFTEESSEPETQEEIIIIDPSRKKKKPKVRTRSMASINQGTRSLAGLGSVLETLQGKSLDSISSYVSNKNGLEDDG